MAFVQARLNDSRVPHTARQQALDRIHSDPGIPKKEGSTKSFWMNDPHPKLSNIQSEKLNEFEDIVVIGSGITATSVAKTLLESTKDTLKPSIVILEARDICSGATGRNGGHLLEIGDEYVDYQETVGAESAARLLRFRLAHLDEIMAVAQEYGISKECQARRVKFHSACFEQSDFDDAVSRVQRAKSVLEDEMRNWEAIPRDKYDQLIGMPDVRGIIIGDAGAMLVKLCRSKRSYDVLTKHRWPYKFVTGVLAELLRRYPHRLRIEANTPVTSVAAETGSNNYKLKVQTPRGDIYARHVIHCTNAHVAHLVPGMKGNIYPVRGQMSAQTPGASFVHQGNSRSWLFNYKDGFDYLTQLPKDEYSDGEMMFGGGFAQSEDLGVGDVGLPNDDKLGFSANIHLRGALAPCFGVDYWGSTQAPGVKQMWTGTMGFSSDGFPWVGQIPASATGRQVDGQGGGSEWISAGFSGEGMVNAWLSGKALGEMLLSHDHDRGSEAPDWLPKQLLITEQRLAAARLPGTLRA